MRLGTGLSQRCRLRLRRRFEWGSSAPKLALLLFVLLVAAGVSPAQLGRGQAPLQQPTSFTPKAGAPKYAPNELLVRFRPGVGKARAESVHALVQAEVASVNLTIPANQTLSTNTVTLAVVRNQNGSAVLNHDGPAGANG